MRQRLGIREQGAAEEVMSDQLAANSGKVVVLPRLWAVGVKKPCSSVGVFVQGRSAGASQTEVATKRNAGISPLRPIRLTTFAQGAPVEMTNSEGRRKGVHGLEVAATNQVAFYRKYTEAMLRRYAVMSLEAGRVPSMLGREMFRGKVTSYKVHGFDDAVIFCHDVENCLKRLSPLEQMLIKRIAVQQYTHGETACMLGIGLRSVVRQYPEALDRLTRVFLAAELLRPLEGCQ